MVYKSLVPFNTNPWPISGSLKKCLPTPNFLNQLLQLQETTTHLKNNRGWEIDSYINIFSSQNVGQQLSDVTPVKENVFLGQKICPCKVTKYAKVSSVDKCADRTCGAKKKRAYHQVNGKNRVPVMKSCIAAIRGSPLRGVTKLDFTCKEKK